MTDHRERVEELLAEYRRSRQHLATVQQRLGAIAETATGAGGAVTATVGSRGTLTGLTITDDAYRRYRPPELAAEILNAVQAATAAALKQAGDVLASALPAGTDPHALLLGTGDLTADEIVVDAAATPAADDEEDDDFAAHSWVAEGRER